MKKLLKPAFFVLLILMMVSESHAQRGRGGFGGTEGGGRGGAAGGRGGDTGGRSSRGGAPSGFGGGRTGGGPTRGGGASGGGFDMSAMASRFDTNKDGKVEPSEFQQIPERFRGMMEQNGVTVNRTVSTADFGKMVTSGFQRMREQREAGGGDRGRGGDDRGRGQDDRNQGGTNGQPVPPALFKMPERVKVIKALSTELAEADVDLDGMVALYEWSQAGLNFEDFYSADRNDDGFVTAQEEQGDIAVDIARFKTDRLTIVTATSTVNNASAKLSFSNSPQGMSATKFAKPEDAQKGRDMFKGIDKDNNGKLSTDEWAKSGKIKSWFESNNIKMTEMNSAEFSQAYGKAVSKYRQDRESKDKKSDRRR